MKQNNVIIGSLCACSCAFIYGMSYIFTKQATGSANALFLLGWRFLIGFIVMSLCAAFGLLKIDIKGKNIKPLLLTALFSPGIYYICETYGISNTTASESGVFLACIPVATIIASTIFLRKKPTKNQLKGTIITLIGAVITVLAVGVSSSFSLKGYIFLLLAIASYAMYCIFADKASDYGDADKTFMMLVLGAIVFVILAFAEAVSTGTVMDLVTLPFKSTGFLIAVLYQGICCSVLAFFLCNIAISKIGVNQTSTFTGISTVVSIVVGALLLKETFSAAQLAGAAIILIGVYIANSRR